LVDLRAAMGYDAFVHEHAEDVLEVMRWLSVERFDRRAVNRQLAQAAATARRTVA